MDGWVECMAEDFEAPSPEYPGGDVEEDGYDKELVMDVDLEEFVDGFCIYREVEDEGDDEKAERKTDDCVQPESAASWWGIHVLGYSLSCLWSLRLSKTEERFNEGEGFAEKL